MTLAVLGALGLALLLAAGLFLVITRTAPRRNLRTRLAPWVAQSSPLAMRDARARAAHTSDSLRITAIRRLASIVARAWQPGEATDVTLARAGLSLSRDAWLARIIESVIFGALGGTALGLAAVLFGSASALAVAAFAFLGGAVGGYARVWLLRRRAKARVRQVLDELPVLCELLSLCLTAGEGFADALERVSARGTGPLALELRASIRSSTLGVPLATALTELARRLDISALTRTIDSIVGGLERGTPLVAVLRTQSSEARAEAARRLQEQASSREVAMLVPLIFLILPVTIAFAIFPGLLVIQSGF